MIGGRKTHARLLCGAAVAVLAMVSGVANAEEAKTFDIPAQLLTTALNQFGVQSQSAVLFTTDLTGAKTSKPVVGAAEPEDALANLLSGSGLTYRREGDVFMIVQVGEGGSSPQDASVGGDVEALIVTAQKKEEAIQDVPIAISAFTQKSLDAQKIEGGFDLLKAIPNVTFSKNNFSGYNFSIRGIGTKAVSATTDPGVAVSFNNTTLIVNRLFEQEYFDVERVEVLRGPQGTLYGRNATSGVINVLSARPRLGEFEADLKLEAGNYDAQRARGMVNIPLGDTLAVRVAGAMTQRIGYGVNEAANDPNASQKVTEDVDGRDLWSARITVGWEPIEAIRVNALWERFEEDDNRVRTSKQLCHHDAGFDNWIDFDWDAYAANKTVWQRPSTSQGCSAGSLYDDGAFGTVNGSSLPYVWGVMMGVVLGEGVGFFTGSGELYGMGGNPYIQPSSNMYNPVFIPNPLEARCAAEAVARTYQPINICQSDPYGGRMQSTDLRTIYSLIDPVYRAKADLFELSVDIDLTDSLSFTSQTVYSEDQVYASQDYNRYTTVPIFNDSDLACGIDENKFFGNRPDCRPGHTPYEGGWYQGLDPRNPMFGPGGILSGGVFHDPQLGASNTMIVQDLSKSRSEQFNQEFRLASNYEADFNFSLGANFTRFETLNDYYVFSNMFTLFTHFFPFNTPPIPAGEQGSAFCGVTPTGKCVYVDPNPLESINGEGHNYFRSSNPYELNSSAIFGELYWQATETVKVTLGARMTWDRKIFTPIASQLLLSDYRYAAEVGEGQGPEVCISAFCQISGTGVNTGEGARGSPPSPKIYQEWREPTGRIIVDWKPDLGFTDETMLYASLAHGYKGGGANPPGIAPPAGIANARNTGVVQPATFDPEYIDAFEVGTKNTLLDGALVLNGSAFYYDYEGYQISKIVDRMAVNDNFDARVWGLELEWIFSPARNLRFNGTVGHLNTELKSGQFSIDLMDRTQGGNQSFTTSTGHTFDRWMVVKPWASASSNCVAPVQLVEESLHGAVTDIGIYAFCPFGNLAGVHYGGESFPSLDGAGYRPTVDAPNGGAGFAADVSGNDLPNAPHWTLSFGAQYRFALPGGWDATARVDHYWQDESFARVYNTEYDRLRAWTNTNFSLWVENPDWGVTAEVYVKNAFDEEPITDAFLNSDDSGLTTNVFTLDPRLVGVSVRKQF